MACPDPAIPSWADLRAVVFDFDGTLAHTNIDFAEMRRRTVEHIRSLGLWEDNLEEWRYLLEMIAQVEARLAPHPARQREYRAAAMAILEDVEMLTCPHAQLFPGIAEALGELSARGLRIGIITRNARRCVAAVLDSHPLPHDVLLTREDVDRVKPDPAHLLAALAALDALPAQALMVGDHPTDMQCGRAAGAHTCGVLTDHTGREELLAAGADAVVASVAALPPLL